MLFALSSTANNSQDEVVTYQGQLKTGKYESTIIYVGSESGDLAAFCFANNSRVGRTILSKCQDKGQCHFSGKVDWEKPCGIKGDFSARARIISVKTVKKLVNKKY
jgi:hypothetical protein